jgi:hypothetical protein
MHRYRDGEVKVNGYLEDYAFLIWGLLELYEATLDSDYLKWGYQLNQILLDKYWDVEDGGFYLTGKDAEDVLMRKKDTLDSALPSGNGIALLNLEQLAALLEDQKLQEFALKQEKAFSSMISQAPTARSIFLVGVINRINPYFEVVISGERDDKQTNKLLEIFKENYLPRAAYSLNSADDDWMKSKVESFQEKKPLDGNATAYPCKQGVCGMPVTSPMKLLEILK